MTTRKAAVAVMVCAALVAAAELAAGGAVAWLAPTHSSEADSNEGCLRGWAEYTSPWNRPAGEQLVIVVSASQGCVRGRGATGPLWPTIVANKLTRLDPSRPVRVLNWSLFGGKAEALAVLFARAVTFEPDAIVLVSTTENFAHAQAIPLLTAGGDANDVARLLDDPAVRELLGPDFGETWADVDLTDDLLATSNLSRLRGDLVLPAITPPRRAHKLCDTPDQMPMSRRLNKNCESPWPEQGYELLDAMARALQHSPRTKLLVVSMPICRPSGPCPTHERWLAEAEERLAADDPRVRMVNLLDALPCDSFLDYLGHLSEAGHEGFADVLVPHVRWMLAR